MRGIRVYLTFFFDFTFDAAYHLIPRVRKHLSFVEDFFEKITVVTIDYRNFTSTLGGTKIAHLPILPLRVPRHAIWILGTVLGIRKLVNAIKLDRSVVFFTSPYALYTIIVARTLKIPLVVHFKYDPTTQPLRTFKRYILNAMINFALRSADMIIVPTRRLKYVAINRINRKDSEKKIFISPNYVDEELFSLSVDGRRIRERLSISQDEKVILYMGRLRHEKGLDVLIEAFSSISNQVYNARLVIVGEGPQRNELEEKCRKLGLSNRVLFLRPVPYTLVPSFLAASDIVVLPSFSEGHPKFLVEAMMMGKPIVATDVIGIKDTVRAGKEAILVKPGDPRALAYALKMLIEDEELARTLGNSAREKALKEYSKKAVFSHAARNPFLILGF
jgi:glycosyltransferase involved in cell wall biosynthesis